MRLLLVEDNVALVDELQPRLRREGYACDWLVDGRDAIVAGTDEAYDGAILDLGLPGFDGLDVLRAWRQSGCTFPVLILTARNSWADRITGLESGAEDYLGKPFHPDELVLRLRRILRRHQGVASSTLLEVNGVKLDEDKRQLCLDAGAVDLTAGEFGLLRYFMLHPDKLLSKSRLNDHLYDVEHESNSNVIEVFVSRLRDELGRDVIETRRGQGYIFRGLQR